MKGFFYSTLNDRRGLAVAFILVLGALGVAVYEGWRSDRAPAAAADSVARSADGPVPRREKPGIGIGYETGRRVKELFPFDPNTADSTQLLRLGLPVWQVRNIYKYRAAGGEFRRKEDFARLYGLTVADYKRLEPYIRITKDYRLAADVYDARPQERRFSDSVRYPVKLKAGELLALNAADTSQLCHVPGVGSRYARAVVALRQRLGGFYTARQLLEIDGFPAEALSFFTVDASQCRRININKATLQQLRRHPYISFYMARDIVEHRRLHGKISSLDELLMYRDFTPDAVSRLKAYISF